MDSRDYREIDLALQKAIDKGYIARMSGKTKYDNNYEPGSLQFDAWQQGFDMKDNWKNHLDGIGG